jgi:hypothetical protein
MLQKLRELQSKLSIIKFQGNGSESEKQQLLVKIDSLKTKIMATIIQKNLNITDNYGNITNRILEEMTETEMEKYALEGKIDALGILEKQYTKRMSILPQKEIELDIPQIETKPVISCLFSPDSVFVVRITETSAINSSKSQNISDAICLLYKDNSHLDTLLYIDNG